MLYLGRNLNVRVGIINIIVNDKNATIKLKNVHINDVKYFDRTSDLELTGRVKYFDFSYFINEFNLLFSNILSLNILGQFFKIILLMVISYTILQEG